MNITDFMNAAQMGIEIKSNIKSLSDLKNKIMSIIGTFLQNGEKLSYLQQVVNKLNFKDKETLLNRIKFLQTRQDETYAKAQKIMKDLDTIQKSLQTFQGADITAYFNTRTWEYIKELLNIAKTDLSIGMEIIKTIELQNKDVANLNDYITKSTKEGFKFELPSLSQITSPISSILTPLAIIVGGVIAYKIFSDINRK